MRKKYKIIIFTCLACLLSFCTGSPDPEMLYGRWKYVKVENLRYPDENMSDQEIAEQSPSISFLKNSDMSIMWGGKQISHGKFRLEKNLIRITEFLPKEKREFPFIIRKLTNEDLIFETMSGITIRVTAKKIH